MYGFIANERFIKVIILDPAYRNERMVLFSALKDLLAVGLTN